MIRNEFSGREMQAIHHLMGSVNEFFIRGEAIASRIAKIKGGKRDYAMLRTKLTRLMERLLEQMDTGQLASLNRQLRGLRVYVTVRRAENMDNLDGHFLTLNDLNTLVNGCAMGCQMCNKTGGEVYKCPLRKVYSRLPTESTMAVTDTHTGGCPYSYMFTGGDGNE